MFDASASKYAIQSITEISYFKSPLNYADRLAQAITSLKFEVHNVWHK